MKNITNAMILWIAQGGYSGRSPVAPGTAGTVVAVFLYLLLRGIGIATYAGVGVAVIVIGTWAAGRAETLLGGKDHSSIVIDEIAGLLVSLFLVPQGWGFVIAGFFLFRFFDIVKPWPLRGLQELPGGLGVMIDDLGAGIYTNVALQIAAHWR